MNEQACVGRQSAQTHGWLQEDAGLTTAEYAVGTIAVIGLGGLMLRLLTSDWFAGLLRTVFESGFEQVGA